jgi:uncharacterized protein
MDLMSGRALRFSRLPGKFTVCRLPPDAQVPDWASSALFSSVTRTADELSIVCALNSVPSEHKPKDPWVCLKLEGPFPLSEVGILASFITPLAEKGVPIFTIATYDTDYVLIGGEHAAVALQALQDAGHELLPWLQSSQH